MRQLARTRRIAWLLAFLCLCFFLSPLGPGGAGRARADDVGSQLREAERSVVRVLGVHYDDAGRVVAVVGGTGFVVAPGKIVTNNHVIAPPEGVARTVYYVVPDRFAGTAGVVAQVQVAWPKSDLAVLSAPDITAPILTVAATPPGKEAVIRAMGYPGVTDEMRGLPMKEKQRPSEPYVTSGSIALFSDTAPGGAKEDTIFHTAPIDHGNSGGPLLDQCSRLIGVNTWSAAGAVSSDGTVESHPGQFAAIGASVLTRLLATAGIEARVETAPCGLGAGPVMAALQPTRLDVPPPAAHPQTGGKPMGGTMLLALVGAGVLVAAALGVTTLLQRQSAAFAGAGGAGPPTLGPTAFLALGVGVVAVVGLFYALSPPKPAAARVETLAATPAAAGARGGLVCAFAAEHSLNPLPRAGVLTLDFDTARGCLNGHSAYVRVDGRYIRLSVNETDRTASRLELSGDLKTFTRRDYALDDSDLAAVAADRAAVAPPSCPAPGAAGAADPQAAAQVRAMLASNAFNGEPARVMTWRCTPPVQAGASAAAGSTGATLDGR